MAVADVGSVAAWILAWVFAWSGVAKLVRPTRAARALSDFGVIRHPTAVAGIATGSVELLIAGLLASGQVPALAAAIAAMLCLGFAVLILRAILDGKRFACFCFGSEDRELSWTAFLRAIILAGVALAATVASERAETPYAVAVSAVAAVTTLGVVVTGSMVATMVRLSNQVEGESA